MIKGKMCAVTKEAFKRFRVDHYHVQLTGVEIYIKITINMGGEGWVVQTLTYVKINRK